jgi:HAD superfamily hydrolase (TIGR01549 family)
MTDYDPDECTRIYRAHYATIACGQTEALPGAADALAALAEAGFKLGFATSKKRSFAELILGHLGFLDYFIARVGPDDVENPKPAPDAIYRAAEQLSLDPPAVLYVGDLPLDHEAATAAGAGCVCVTTGYATREVLEAAGIEHVFDGLAEVADHVLARNGRG